VVGISVGDLNGIGREIILKTFEDSRMLEFCTPIVFANTKVFSLTNKELKTNISFHGIDNIEHMVAGKLNILNIWKEDTVIESGTENKELGKYAVLSVKQATQSLKKNQIDVLVTAPISKYTAESDEFHFAGHTDYLNQELEGDALMLLVSNYLKIGLLTEHISIKEVSSKFTEALIQKKIEILQKSLIQDFGINRPKIAILGLNPHCGDGGIIGDEDDKILKPTIKKLFDNGCLVFGPFPADGFFGNQSYKKYDAILATYHDQGLIPFKTISFGQGVNYTAGLNRIRTSPDHGTAFDIAGKQKADESSFRQAIYLAIDIFRKRNQYMEISKNPLKISNKKLSYKYE